MVGVGVKGRVRVRVRATPLQCRAKEDECQRCWDQKPLPARVKVILRLILR